MALLTILLLQSYKRSVVSVMAHLNMRISLAVIVFMHTITMMVAPTAADDCPSSTARAIGNFKRTPSQLRVYFTFKYQCDGVVSQYNFYAKNIGRFYVGAWRQLNATTWINVGSNAIDVTTTGEQLYSVPLNEQIVVDKDDVIGIHYKRRTKGVLPQAPPANVGVATKYSKYHISRLYADNINPHTTVQANVARRARTIALNPVVDTCDFSLINDIPYWIPDSQITASTFYTADTPRCSIQLLRLWDNPTDKQWCAGPNNLNQWVEMQFNDTRIVRQILLKGRPSYNQYITSYTVEYLIDGSWAFMLDALNQPLVFQGSQSAAAVSTTTLPEPLYADAIKIHPRSWNNHITSRFDIRGC